MILCNEVIGNFGLEPKVVIDLRSWGRQFGPRVTSPRYTESV